MPPLTESCSENRAESSNCEVERWLRGQEHELLLQRIQFTASNESSQPPTTKVPEDSMPVPNAQEFIMHECGGHAYTQTQTHKKVLTAII